MTQAGGYGTWIVSGILQSVIITAICGFFGYILAEKTGLMKAWPFEKEKFLT